MASKTLKTFQKISTCLGGCNGWGEAWSWVWEVSSALGLQPPLGFFSLGSEVVIFPGLRGCSLVSACPRLKLGFKLEIRAFGGRGRLGSLSATKSN